MHGAGDPPTRDRHRREPWHRPGRRRPARGRGLAGPQRRPMPSRGPGPKRPFRRGGPERFPWRWPRRSPGSSPRGRSPDSSTTRPSRPSARLEDTTDGDFDALLAVNMRAPMICARSPRAGHARRGFRTASSAFRAAPISARPGGPPMRARKGGSCRWPGSGPLELARARRDQQRGRSGSDSHRALRSRQSAGDAPHPGDRRVHPRAAHGNSPRTWPTPRAFFMDERAGYVTGQVLYVCGGVTLSRGGN